MLKNKRIRCVISKTKQPIQFEPVKVEVEASGDIPDGINMEEEAKKLLDFVSAQVDCQMGVELG